MMWKDRWTAWPIAFAIVCTGSSGPGSKTIGLASLDREGQSVVPPDPEPPFAGKIGRTIDESVPAFPPQVRAPAGAPNVILIMTDDVGFGASSTFGGPIDTPAFTRLADNGLRYNRFHTTAICAPTRAALLTGRNHHSAGSGLFPNFATGFPGYAGRIPKSVGTVAEVLKQNGYSTAMVGKNHSTPLAELGSTGPFDNWPNGLGFEYFYGFNAHGVNHWAPPLYENTVAVEPPAEPGYHLDKDLADHAIAWIRRHEAQVPDKPFFVFYSTGSAHAPHHAPKEWIARFRGKFDQGWDKLREETFRRQKAAGIIPSNTRLTPRPEGIPAWDSLTGQQKRVYARMMEVYAGMVAYTDSQIGRVMAAVDALGERDNTLVIFVQGDNGGSAEGTLQGNLNETVILHGQASETLDYLESMMDEMGGPRTYGHYPAGWAWATSSPFQWTKQIASHFGGTRNGLVISWPGHIRPDSAVRPQFHHVIDVVPTIYNASGIKPPSMLNGVSQKPLEGVAMNYTFGSAHEPGRKNTQYFELIGNRGIYHDGWFANTTPRRVPWEVGSRPPGNAATDYEWELYDLTSDFSQATNLAAQRPRKLEQMIELFWVEAKKHDVLPIEDSFTDRGRRVALLPGLQSGRTSFRYTSPVNRIPVSVGPQIGIGDFDLIAKVVISPGVRADGMLATFGGRFGGWAFYLKDGRPKLVHVLTQQEQYHYAVASDRQIPPGENEVRFHVDYDGNRAGTAATASIYMNGELVGTGRFARTLPGVIGSGHETFDIGVDTGTPVSDDYALPFRFDGEIREILVELNPSQD